MKEKFSGNIKIRTSNPLCNSPVYDLLGILVENGYTTMVNRRDDTYYIYYTEAKGVKSDRNTDNLG